MPRPTVTYEEVASCCARLEEDGQKLSVRRIQSEVGGGSNSTILAHFQRWLEEQRRLKEGARVGDDLISPTLRAALVEEITRQQGAARESADRQLQEIRDLYCAASDALRKAEGRLEDTETQLETERRQWSERARELERDLAAFKARAEQGNQQAAALQQRFDTERREAERARLEAAEMRLQTGNSVEAIKSLREAKRELRSALDAQQSRASAAEQRAAVADAKAEAARSRLDELSAEVVELKSEAKELRSALEQAQAAAGQAEKSAEVARRDAEIANARRGLAEATARRVAARQRRQRQQRARRTSDDGAAIPSPSAEEQGGESVPEPAFDPSDTIEGAA